jgi:hypothetical protein
MQQVFGMILPPRFVSCVQRRGEVVFATVLALEQGAAAESLAALLKGRL